MLWGIWVFKIYPTQNFSKTFQVLWPIHLLVLGSVLVSSTAQNSSFMRHDSILSLHSHSAFPSPLSTTHPLRIFKNMWVVSPEWLLLLFSHWVMSNSLWPHELQHTRFPCPSLSPRVCSNSCPLSQWYHPTISSSVTPFSSCPQSSPASVSFPVNQLFTPGGQSIGATASAWVLPMNIQGWFPLG